MTVPLIEPEPIREAGPLPWLALAAPPLEPLEGLEGPQQAATKASNHKANGGQRRRRGVGARNMSVLENR
jgi:hypothetical protein